MDLWKCSLTLGLPRLRLPGRAAGGKLTQESWLLLSWLDGTRRERGGGDCTLYTSLPPHLYREVYSCTDHQTTVPRTSTAILTPSATLFIILMNSHWRLYNWEHANTPHHNTICSHYISSPPARRGGIVLWINCLELLYLTKQVGKLILRLTFSSN